MNQIEVELQEHMGSDRSIAEAAWTSSLTLQGKNKRTEEDVQRVIQFLIENKHASPIESVVMRFWIKMPIAIDRQHMTHRIGSHNGMSGRYRTMPSEWLHVPQDVQHILALALESSPQHIIDEYEELCNKANTWYKNTTSYLKTRENKEIDNKQYKRLREFFRGVLPQHNMTERTTIFNLRSFANYQKLRNSEHAQPEIKLVAELMLNEVKRKNIAPLAISVLESKGWEI